MADIQLYPGETLVKESEAGSKIKGAGSFRQGKGFLTNQRIVVHRRSIWTQAIFGLLISYAFKGKFYFDIPLTSIQTIYKGSVALNRNIFCIQTRDGKEYMLVVNFKDWLAAVGDALRVYHQLNLVDDGVQRWKVQG